MRATHIDDISHNIVTRVDACCELCEKYGDMVLWGMSRHAEYHKEARTSPSKLLKDCQKRSGARSSERHGRSVRSVSNRRSARQQAQSTGPSPASYSRPR